MRQTTSPASEKAWNLAGPQNPVHAAKGLAEEAAKLLLARVPSRGQRDDAWQLQTYQDFADQVQRKNPDVSFTHDLMDESLRTAVSLLPKSAYGGSRANRENMLTRVSIVWA